MPLSASTSFKLFNPERSAAAKILLEDRQNEHTRSPKEKEGKRGQIYSSYSTSSVTVISTETGLLVLEENTSANSPFILRSGLAEFFFIFGNCSTSYPAHRKRGQIYFSYS
ncbi:hypothetical protein NS990_29785, partial [Pseudomonas aeruginosa]|uniref:hypothetical protein n=1 Tax=Pseudomonas aeruginosa TaxID=287 RepID=UPI001C8C76BE